MRHVHPEYLVIAVCKWPPYLGDDCFIGQHPACVVGQQGYQLVFNLRQMHVLVIYLNKTALKVNEQAAYFVFGVLDRKSVV